MPLNTLPSENYLAGSFKPIGFANEPDQRYVAQAQNMLEELAAVFATSSLAKRLTVTLCHFRHNHLMSPKLFGFSVPSFDEAGRFVDPVTTGQGVRYAVGVNLPVELQRESALAFLAQLLLRQSALAYLARRCRASGIGPWSR